jgi:cobalt-precorrin-5B (C1)-methyltransferase
MNINKSPTIKSGYTLPVFAVASAMASLMYLKEEKEIKTLSVELIKPPQTAIIKIEQVAKIEQNKALAITLSDPGDNLDITRHTPVWAMVEIKNTNNNNPEEKIIMKGGEGIGKKIKENNQPAIYNYAKELMIFNLKKLLKPEETIIVTIILPQGKQLAKKTSNEAFGVVEGLSLLGTTGISQALTSPAQLDQYLAELNNKAQQFKTLVFCIGENGLNLGKIMGIKEQQLIKTANWLSPMLIQASLQSVENILLLGYHGKLIKLAGGIFHTHHHLADGRREILTAHSAKLGLPSAILQEIFNSETAEDVLNLLRNLDAQTNSNWVKTIYDQIALTIDQRTQAHIQNHSPNFVRIGSLLFDRQRQVIVKSSQGTSIFADLCYNGLNF